MATIFSILCMVASIYLLFQEVPGWKPWVQISAAILLWVCSITFMVGG